MHTTASSVIKDAVLVGESFADFEVLRLFGMKPLPGVRLAFITGANRAAAPIARP